VDNRIPNARWPAVGVLNSRPDKHVEAGGFSLKDRGSTPLASTFLIFRDLHKKLGHGKTASNTIFTVLRQEIASLFGALLWRLTMKVV